MQSGSCHGGAVKFTAQGEIEHAIECNCSYCSRKGFLQWFVPKDAFAIAAGEGSPNTYTFNKHAIAHQFCSKCGCQAIGLGSMPDGTKIAAINIRCVDNIGLAAVKRVSANGKDF